MRDSEMERSNVHLPVEMKEAVKERSDMTIAEACRIGLEIATKGEESASVEQMNERDLEVLSLVESEYRPLEEELSNAAPSLAERIREARLSVTHEVAGDCYERVQWAESEADARESDTEAVSPGYEKSPVEAAESLLNPDGTMVNRIRIEGAENPAVETQAKKCGMDPDEFWELAQEELPDEALESPVRSTRTATDGGGLP